jgi:hypothetical protein
VITSTILSYRTHMERCDLRLTPNTYRECTSESRCIGEWFIGPWSSCQGDCFNASRSRTVVCIKEDGFAEESECDLKNKPATFEDCTQEEMKDCRPKWHHSDWTEVKFASSHFHKLTFSLPPPSARSRAETDSRREQ